MIFHRIVYQELRNLVKWREQQGEKRFNVQDLSDVLNGIRELQLLKVETELIKQLAYDTKQFLKNDSTIDKA